ncbi:sigma-70 family RNA polymerase sigma factor [Hyphomicrobium sp. CS1BSMeth3]|uniref:sigma-70 family RNA polymerase sigma factor n=1 Tax=Hyphomicrobium sp. CS1BSMeth3 TaxID=1892844 RepID=UPI0009300786|nr:sigma-70 family RNA polymerase sigma factor [Hyphomicrobium sp. CS1BSMeth3]
MKPPPDDALDVELMRAVGRQDRHAFARLVERHYGWALGFTDRMLGTRHEAEDMVQTAFLRVWQGAGRWEPHAKFTTWLYRVLYNLCVDRLRARQTASGEPLDDALVERLADEAPTGEERITSLQRGARVRAALDQLPARQRAALVLCYYEERSQAEAAALLGVSAGALESLLSRGRATLKKWLRDELQ